MSSPYGNYKQMDNLWKVPLQHQVPDEGQVDLYYPYLDALIIPDEKMLWDRAGKK